MRVLVALALAGGLSCSRSPGRPPNLILVTLDTTRLDHLGCYGDLRAHTPTLDSLASEGTRFLQAVTTVPLTLPSHSSIFTGLYPTRHGVQDNGTFFLDASFPLIQERLKERGYQTGAFVSAFVLARQFGLARGFEAYDDHFYNERPGLRTNRAANAWIDRLDPARPCFLWVHYFDAHAPWEPPAPYRQMDLPSPYAQEVAAADGALRSLLHRLRTRGLLESAAILVVADHGEGLGDHGEREHGTFLYDETIRVPLVLCLPRRSKVPAVDTEVSVVDIAPTLLEIARAAPLEGIDGQSLLPLLQGRPWSPRRAVYCETYFPKYNYFHSALMALRTPRWKYVRAPRPELYDLQADPEEKTNLVASQPDTALLFSERLDRFLSTLPVVNQGPSEMSKEDRERLQSLGYLSGGELTEGEGENLPDPKDMIPYIDLFATGHEALRERRWNEAILAYQAVLEHNPGNLIAIMNLGQALGRTRRYGEAIDILERGRRLAPDNASLAKHLGQMYRLQGEPEKGMEVYRQAARDPTQHWNGVFGVAGCLMDLGRLEEARQWLEEAAQGEPPASPARGMAEAVERYKLARSRLSSHQADEAVRLEVASMALDLGLMREVRRLLSPGVRGPALEGKRHRLLASLAGMEGDLERALSEFESARQLLPNDAYVEEHLAPLYLEFNRPQEALAAAQAAIRLGRVDARNYYNQACAHARLGQTGQAVDALEKAIQQGYSDAPKILEDPDLASLWDHPRLQELAERASRR